VVLLLKPKRHYVSIELWMSISSIVLMLVNFTGFINFIYVYISGNGLLDDAFNGLYGRSGLSMHTFSLVNFIYCTYYFTKANYKRAIFFLLSGFMCFYGLGVLLFVGALGIVFLINLNKKYFKYVILLPLSSWLIIFISTKINPTAFSYMNENIEKVIRVVRDKQPYESELSDVKKFKTVKTPRKIMAFEGGLRVLSNPKFLLFGVSPGTYNSRVSFLLNGEYTRNKIFKNIKNRPIYANEDIYPLWNKNITFQYNDGTRNEPFSSILALMVEYGILQTLLICFLFWQSFWRVKDQNRKHKFFIQFLFVFFFLNLLTENYLEYPEFIFLIIIIYKSIESANVKKGYS
tara:strand:- start:4846 stop:5886 length:1041 start_codon:yes stop_codon:yes gene_type:complete